MALQKSLLKVYGDRAYRHVTMARHQGTTIAFAMDAGRRIVYSVLDLSGPPTKGEVDAAYWSENPAELVFPRELAEVGYAVVGATAMPTVKRGGAEAAPGDQPAEEEIDPHLSTTGRLTADAPFQVVSDGTYVVVLRQSVGAADPGAVYKLAGGGSSANASRSDYVLDGGGAKVPLVRDTLLCDRFLLVDGKLKPVLEARFKRSRHATRPESAKDSLGTEDMEGRPFYEPTQELSIVRNLTQGRFAAVLVPTGVANVQRWQLFAHNDATGRVDGFSVEQGGQGLFNTQGTRFYTSPDPAFQDAVFERSPGTCPFTGRDLVPVASAGGHAETALRLDGAGAYVDLGDPAALRFGGRAYSVEAWVRPAAPEGPLLGRAGEFQLALDASGALRLTHEGAPAPLVATDTLPVDVYTHVAATFDGTTAKLYVNGRPAASGPLPFTPGARLPVLVGRQDAAGTLRHFSGDVDELRIWNRVRSAAELAEDLGHRLIGNEPGLTAYYRFDEGTGTTAYDQSDSALHGRIEGAARWTGSDAPVGDHPGVRRDSFVLKGRTVVSGMSAVLYHQQENVVSGYRADPKPAKRQARVLLAFAAKYGQEPCLATLDFAVGRDGRLAEVPDVLEPQVLKRPTRGQDSERISELQQVIKRLEPEIAALPAEIARLSGTAALLPQRQAAQNALRPEYDGYESAYKAEAVKPGAWLYTLELKTPRVINGKTVRWVYGEPYGGVGVTGDDGPRTTWALAGVDPRSADSSVFRLATTDAKGYGLLLAASDSNFSYGELGLPREPFATPDARAETYFRFTMIREGDYVRIVNQASGMAIGLPADSKTGSLRHSSEFRTADSGLFKLTKVRLQWPIDVFFFAAKEKMDAARAAVQESLTAGRRITERQLELATKRAELHTSQDELAALSTALQGDDDLTLPMPQLAVDATGLSLNGALLEFARGGDRPALLDSGTGNIVLYLRGTDDQFSAVYYDTAVIRGLQTMDGDGGTLGFLARDPALPLDGCTITVSDGDAPGRCDLTITVGAETETWRSLPRRAAQFAAALAGDPGRPVTVGQVARVSGTTVELTESSAVVLPAKAHLQIGSAGCAVAADTPVGAKALTLTAEAAAVKPGDKVTLVGYDWGRAASTRPGVLLSNGSRLVGLNPGEVEFVPNGTAKPAIAGRGCRWRAEMPGRAFQFSGADQYLTLPAGKHPGIAPSGDLTLEAWVNPETGQGRILHARTDDSGYSLSLVPAALPVKQFAGAEKLVLTDSLDLANRDFTIELWAKRNQSRGRTEPLLTHGAPGGVRDQSLHLVFDPAETFRFGLYGDDLATDQAYPDLEWHHWAAVYKNATREQILYRDGIEVGRRTATGAYTGNGPLVLGCQPFSGAYLDGRIDEVRVFGRARTQREIAAERNGRLSGREPALLGYWTFDGPAGSSSPIKGYQVVARVGDRVVKSAERFACNEWAHLATTFTQSWALRMDTAVGLSVEPQDALDLLEDLTIEAFVRLDRTGTPMGLVAKGNAVDGGQAGVPYQFGVLADGRLEFAFAEADGKAVRFTSTQALTPGTVQKVGVVRERRQPAPAAATSGGTQPPAPDQPEQYVRFYIGGTLAGNHLYSGPGAQANGSELEIGRGLTGVLGEVRIWNAARTANQIGLPVTPREKGLLARWAFDENAGNVAFDHSGSFPAKLRGARWTRDPDPAASPLRLYRNGEPLAEGTVTAQDSTPWGEPQLTLGARLEGGKPADPFTGTLEEVRIWRTVRTAEQISDNLFSRLRGDKQDLLGYWPFDRDSTEPGTTSVRDEGLRGNSLDFSAKRPRILLSTAPISTDTAQVRSALADVRTPFHETVSGAPGASEYADLQYDAKGEALGVLKRCYAYVRDGRWHLVTGYKVGDLTTEWVGQAQFDPQLVGYVEGAPPVPSENLVDGAGDHTGASSVEFTEAEEVVQSLSSSKERSVDAAFNFSFGFTTDIDTMTVTAPLGVGIAKPLFSGRFQLGISGGLEFSNTWSSETQVSQGTNTTRKTRLALTGQPEDPAKLVNPAVGRRYVPANTGMALVQSQTADVFALRLAHTGALIAYRMLPNPDIPLDWNIIHFPINPRYTKQGTLDGAVGFNERGKVTDPDYPTATAYGEYSYFKPRDAYALKRRITRDQQRLQAYYRSISTETDQRGANDPAEAQARTVLRSMGMDVAPPAGDSRSGGPNTTADGFSHRDLVNTYVWTAQGGFFAETTEATDAVSETTAGSYSFHGSVGGFTDMAFSAIDLGFDLHMDASVGGGFSNTRAKGKDASRSFGLDVQCAPSGDLQRRDADGKLAYDPAGRPVLVPGKVDAYRFLTFYLGETSANFDDFYRKVVDPIWLQGSGAPDAAALRQARQSSVKPPCWRILHRVTYVSRVLPPVPPPGAPPLEQAMRAENIDSNYELIRRLEPYVRPAATSTGALSAATRQVLATQLPELLPHAAEITDYLARYLGIDG